MNKKPWYLAFVPKSAWHWILDIILDSVVPLAARTESTLDDKGIEIVRKLGHKAINTYL